MTELSSGYFEINNGIIFFTFKKGIVINQSLAMELVKNRNEISRGKTFPILIDGNGVVSLDKKARDFLGSERGQEGLSAGAFLCNSFFTYITTRFFLNLTASNRKIPVKIFKDKAKAIQWLEKYKV